MPGTRVDFILTDTSDKRIVKGETKTSLVFVLSGGDRSDWIPYGEVRTNYKYLTSTLLGQIPFFPPEYDSLTDSTKIRLNLTWQFTEFMDMHEIRKGKPIIGQNLWVYEIDLMSPGDVIKIRIAQGMWEFNPMVILREV